MPEMDGYEATRAIKAICSDPFVPVICITSLSQEKALVDCIEAEADDFIAQTPLGAVWSSRFDRV